ncbi:MAG: CPBP family intramembrane metalloprotease [Anaerolineales bacterium]|jgi:membrane protease YdiL (CAAX protease family)|nr:CPBP family intramembrane metalloprotease [Anaerolineales bacterium]
MKNKSEIHRIWIFILFAFSIAWLAALVIAFTGGIKNSPVIFPGLGLKLAIVLIASVYMTAPAFANVLTRIVTREGWSNTWLRFHFKSGWRYWLASWLLVPLFVFGGVIAYYLLFPSQFDPSLARIRQVLPAGVVTLNPWVIVALQALQGIVLSVFINAPFTLGEEFGWRAYLLQKLLPIGTRRAVFISGVIIGIWHWPVIAMGHNYGVNYRGFPVLGMLVMVLFCIVLSFFLSWAVLRAQSVWPGVIGHAILNGLGSIGILFAAEEIYPLLGPSPAGIIGCIVFTFFTLWVLLDPRALPSQMSCQNDIEGGRK